MSLLEAHLTVELPSGRRILSDVRFDLEGGEILGIIGRSGSGKSTLAMALPGLLDRRSVRVTGSVLLEGRDILTMTEGQARTVRGRRIALVLQAAASALNPYVRLGDQIREAWTAHADGNWSGARENVLHTLRQLDLDCDDSFLRRYPGQISVGQAQRVLIAMSVLHNPAVLIADEPTSALDPIAAAEVLTLMRCLNRDRGMAIVHISHDLASIASLAHRLLILENGSVIEHGPTAAIFANPTAEYTRKLITATRAEVTTA